MLAVLKCQHFKGNGSDKTKPKKSKCQYLDKRDNEQENGLDKNEGEIEDTRYVFLLLFFQKVSNCLSDLGKRIKNLNNLIGILKICYSRTANFALEFLGRRGSKAQKKIHTSRLRGGLESHLAFITSTAFGIIHYYCPINKRLKSHLFFNNGQDLGIQLCANPRQRSKSHSAATLFNLFINASNIPKIIFLPIKSPAIGHSLWRGHCCYLEIQDLTLASRSLWNSLERLLFIQF